MSGVTHDLRLGRWQDVLADAGEVDALIADPPFSERTHAGQRIGGKDPRYTPEATTATLVAHGLPYDHWTPEDVAEFVDAWSARCRGWFVAFTSHDLFPVYEQRLEAAGRWVGPPVPAVQVHRNCRMCGGGPSSWTDWLVVARPRTEEFSRWKTTRGVYYGKPFDPGENMLDRSKRVPGGKPLWMMRAIVRDYTLAGNRVCDPCAGGGATLVAAVREARSAIGSEVDAGRFAKAESALKKSWTKELPLDATVAQLTPGTLPGMGGA